MTDMSFILVYRAISDCVRELADTPVGEFERRERVIRACERGVMEKYLKDVDGSNPAHIVILAFLEVKLAGLRLSVRQRRTEKARSHSIEGGRYQYVLPSPSTFPFFPYILGNSNTPPESSPKPSPS